MPSRKRSRSIATALLLVACFLKLSSAYPSGPYITPGNSSTVITLPDPPTPAITSRTGCPHTASGLKNWHDVKTWGGSLPGSNQDITLPANTKVLLNKPLKPKLGFITIPKSSELIIGEHIKGIELNAKGIAVLGKLTVGSSTCRIIEHVTITLFGKRPADAVTNPPPPTYKGISVTGTLDLHGQRYFQTWARLAKTVSPGDQVLLLQNKVNWEAGQQIVLVTSSMYDSRAWHQNEVLTVSSVDANPPEGIGAIVYLNEKVKYSHTANAHYQVEVGLLTRMIKVQGSAVDSEPTNPETFNCKTKYDDWHFLYNLPQPCMNKETTGFGGHIIVHSGGLGRVEGVELYRMGQTNVMGRYPMHFHLLGKCSACYFKDSSVHRSYYRCISIHGTDNTLVSENVAYDVTGYCYYLEDGVEQYNTLSFNLAAHIHTLGPDIATGDSQTTSVYDQSDTLNLPADVTAAGFYITNIRNNIIGNAASGGWAGFAFPSLPTAIGLFKEKRKFRPSNVPSLTIDGNTAHSTAFWWESAGAFYIGGALYYKKDGETLQYNPGRSFNFQRDDRNPCNVNACAPPYGHCSWGCPDDKKAWFRMSNTKAFLTAGIGINSWSGRAEIIGYESYDSGLAAASLTSDGFWIDKMHAVCRTGVPLGLPPPAIATKLEGSGFYWYDTGQTHIITNSTFKNCGYRSDEYDQYDNSATRGCGDNVKSGCDDESTVFGFLTHSDEFTPEVMQGTRAIQMEDCGRRFKFQEGPTKDTVSGRGQNWLDVDGSISGLGEPTLIGSGLDSVKDWWGVDDEVVYDEQAPLRFIKKNAGPERSIAHFRMSWSKDLHDQVGSQQCSNGWPVRPCATQGYMRHLGHKFSPATASKRLPVTANPDCVGPAGGFGWHLKLNQGAPRKLVIEEVEVDPDSTLLLSIAYPLLTTFTISAEQTWCWEDDDYTCREVFKSVSSRDAVRNSKGNTYHVDENGVLTFRVFQLANLFTGNPDWIFPTYETKARDGINNALPRFERGGVVLPNSNYGVWLEIQAGCGGTGDYCSGPVFNYDPDVCEDGFEQVAYDKCCSQSLCKFADGSTTVP